MSDPSDHRAASSTRERQAESSEAPVEPAPGADRSMSDDRWEPPSLQPENSPPPPPERSEPDSRSRRSSWKWWGAAAAIVAAFGVLVLVIIAAAGDRETNSYYTRPISTNHQEERAARESPVVAEQLAPVNGYHYLDALEVENSYMFAWIDQFGDGAYRGASMHSVIAADPALNTTQGEVGFLVLVELARPVSGDDQILAVDGMTFHNAINGNQVDDPPIAELDIAGTTVYVFEDPSSPNSRFIYTWRNDDVQAFMDGAGRREIEQWLNEYLPFFETGPG